MSAWYRYDVEYYYEEENKVESAAGLVRANNYEAAINQVTEDYGESSLDSIKLTKVEEFNCLEFIKIIDLFEDMGTGMSPEVIEDLIKRAKEAALS